MTIPLRARAAAALDSLVSTRRVDAVDFSSEINRVLKPRRRLGPGELHIKAIYLVSDGINAFGGSVPPDELERMRELSVNVPVLVGHQKQSLPLGRTFRAELVRRDGRTWLKVWFYWLRDGGQGDRLRAEIDGGVVREASVSFVFDRPECTECHDDYRLCPHDAPRGTEPVARYRYRGIGRVLEVSLVYRGAVEGTRIVDAGDGSGAYAGDKSAEHTDSTAFRSSAPSGFRLWLRDDPDGSLAYLSLWDGQLWRHWLIPQFSLPHFRRGARFLAYPLGGVPPTCRYQPSDSGLARVESNRRGHLLLECVGREIAGSVVIRPTRLDGGANLIYREIEAPADASKASAAVTPAEDEHEA